MVSKKSKARGAASLLQKLGDLSASGPARWTAIGLFVGAVIVTLDVRFTGGRWIKGPIQWTANELKVRVGLWRSGVNRRTTAGLSALTRNHCAAPAAADAPAPKSASGARIAQAQCACVAFVHGLGDQALTWRRLLEEPESAWGFPLRLVAWDLPGSGDTPALSEEETQNGGYRARKLASRLKQALQEYTPACPRWTVVGNSFGGWVAAWLALDWPEGVDQLVLADSAGFQLSPRERKERLLEPTVQSLQDFQRKAYAHPRPLTTAQWAWAIERIKRSPVQAIRKSQIPEDDLDHHLRGITQKTLIVWGEADRVTPLAYSERFQRAIPRSHRVVFPNCGHLPQKECPAALLDAWKAWWSRPAL